MTVITVAPAKPSDQRKLIHEGVLPFLYPAGKNGPLKDLYK
jgi:hypothetical protein